MKAMAAKQPSQDFHKQHQEVVQAPVLQNEFPVTDAIVLQRMSACPCDGGCPSCEGGMVIQPKLRIGEPGDWYEREADRVAAEVVSRINAPHRKAVQHQELFEEIEEQIQMKPLAQQIHSFSEQNFTVGREMGVTPNLEMSIRRTRSDGNFLPERIREPIEEVFGTDFSKVRIHTDAVSHRQNQALKANAFTMGQDIFFREGAYNPGNNQGRELLVHELTHVIQQKKSKSSTKIIQLSPITDFQTVLLTVYIEDDIREQLTMAINSIQLADLEEAEELFEMLNNPCSEESLADVFDRSLDLEYQDGLLDYLWRRILRLRDEFHTQVESQRPQLAQFQSPQAPAVGREQQVPPRQQQLTEEVTRPPPLHSRTEPTQGEEEISYLENGELREEINSILEPGLYPEYMPDEQLEYEIRLIRLWFSRNPTDQLNDQLMGAQQAREIVAFERQGIPSEPQQQLTEEVARPPPLHSRTEPVQGEEETTYLENEELREEINSILEPGLYPEYMSDEQLEYEIRLIRLCFSRNLTDQLNDQLMGAQQAREIVAFERQGIPSEPQEETSMFLQAVPSEDFNASVSPSGGVLTYYRDLERRVVLEVDPEAQTERVPFAYQYVPPTPARQWPIIRIVAAPGVSIRMEEFPLGHIINLQNPVVEIYRVQDLEQVPLQDQPIIPSTYLGRTDIGVLQEPIIAMMAGIEVIRRSNGLDIIHSRNGLTLRITAPRHLATTSFAYEVIPGDISQSTIIRIVKTPETQVDLLGVRRGEGWDLLQIEVYNVNNITEVPHQGQPIVDIVRERGLTPTPVRSSQESETFEFTTTTMAADFLMGSIPFGIGWRLDLDEFIGAIETGQDRWGRSVSDYEYLILGAGLVIPIGGEIIGLFRPLVRVGRNMSRNNDELLDLIRAADNLDATQQQRIQNWAEMIEQGELVPVNEYRQFIGELNIRPPPLTEGLEPPLTPTTRQLTEGPEPPITPPERPRFGVIPGEGTGPRPRPPPQSTVGPGPPNGPIRIVVGRTPEDQQIIESAIEQHIGPLESVTTRTMNSSGNPGPSHYNFRLENALEQQPSLEGSVSEIFLERTGINISNETGYYLGVGTAGIENARRMLQPGGRLSILENTGHYGSSDEALRTIRDATSGSFEVEDYRVFNIIVRGRAIEQILVRLSRSP